MALIYFALTRGLPWIQEQFAPTARSYEASEGDTSDPAGPCIESVARANDSLSQLGRRFSSGPVDADEWSTASWDIESRDSRRRDVLHLSLRSLSQGGRGGRRVADDVLAVRCHGPRYGHDLRQSSSESGESLRPPRRSSLTGRILSASTPPRHIAVKKLTASTR